MRNIICEGIGRARDRVALLSEVCQAVDGGFIYMDVSDRFVCMNSYTDLVARRVITRMQYLGIICTILLEAIPEPTN